MKRLVIYVHGKGGSAAEAEHYRPLFAESDVLGFDYKSQNPWEAKSEFSQFFDLHSKGYDSVILIANSIGAFLSMYTLAEKKISQALFISPIVNMEKLITDMMMWSNVAEDELQSKKEIPTVLGETLSWAYLCYVREHPIVWSIPTCILYGEKDNLTSIDTISEFANQIGATLTVMENRLRRLSVLFLKCMPKGAPCKKYYTILTSIISKVSAEKILSRIIFTIF